MSFANNQVFGDDVTKTYTSAVYPLGTERLVLGSQTGVGDQAYIFVKTDADLAAGDVVVRKTTSAHGNVTPSAGGAAVNAATFMGVAASAIPAASAADGSSGPYGWIIKRGVCTANVGAAYVQDQSGLVVGVTAKVFTTTASATTAMVGYPIGLSSGGAGVAGTATVYISAL